MSQYFQEANDANFTQVVLVSDRPVLVDFWAQWCGSCRALAPIVEALAKRYAETARVVKLNVDDNPSVVQRYGVQAIPTLILFQDGEGKERIIGAASQDAIALAIDKHLKAALN